MLAYCPTIQRKRINFWWPELNFYPGSTVVRLIIQSEQNLCIVTFLMFFYNKWSKESHRKHSMPLYKKKFLIN